MFYRRMMWYALHSYLAIGLFLLFFVLQGCSGPGENIKSNPSAMNDTVNSIYYRQAMEHFLNGSAKEAKNDFAAAILDYQDALNLYPSAGIYYAIAKNYYQLNKLALAVQNARKAVELDSSVTEYLYLLQDIYTSAKQNDSAIVVLNKILAKDSSEAEAYYKLGRLYEVNRPRQAIAVYERLLSLIGLEWNVLLRIAEMNERLGDYKSSVNTLNRLLTLDPSNSELKKLIIEFYIKDENYSDALNTIADLLTEYPDDLKLLELKAEIFIVQGQWIEASKIYAPLLESKDTPLENKVRIGAQYYAASEKDSSLLPIARSIFEGIDKDTTDWQVKMYLGAISMQMRNDSLAVNFFEKVVELAPWNVEAWIRLGGILFDSQKYDKVIVLMSQGVEKFPEEFAINLLLGIAYSQTDKHESALPYLQKSVKLNPSDLNALSSYGYTLNKIGKPDEAIQQLKKALILDPTNTNIMGTLGLIYDDHERWQECDSIYTAALEIDSVNALILNNYAYSLSKRGVNLELALSMVDKALEKEPTNSSYLDTKGWVLYKMKKYKEAREYIQRSLEIGGEKAVILDHLGDVVFQLGEKEEALKLWKKALELDKNNSEIKKKIEQGTL